MMQRIGVFVCHCGTNIAGTVDVKAVAEALSHENGVAFSTDYQYMCSENGQNLIHVLPGGAKHDHRCNSSAFPHGHCDLLLLPQNA